MLWTILSILTALLILVMVVRFIMEFTGMVIGIKLANVVVLGALAVLLVWFVQMAIGAV